MINLFSVHHVIGHKLQFNRLDVLDGRYPLSYNQRHSRVSTMEKEWGKCQKLGRVCFSKAISFQLFSELSGDNWLNVKHQANHSKSLEHRMQRLRSKCLVNLYTDEAKCGTIIKQHTITLTSTCVVHTLSRI